MGVYRVEFSYSGFIDIDADSFEDAEALATDLGDDDFFEALSDSPDDYYIHCIEDNEDDLEDDLDNDCGYNPFTGEYDYDN